jgi:hypothetical protein
MTAGARCHLATVHRSEVRDDCIGYRDNDGRRPMGNRSSSRSMNAGIADMHPPMSDPLGGSSSRRLVIRGDGEDHRQLGGLMFKVFKSHAVRT